MTERHLTHVMLGDGPKVTLLLHGLLGSRRNLGAFARRWAERDRERRLLLLDLTGHGDSPPLPEGADLSSVAEDVLHAALTLGRGSPVEIVGHSLGGRVALCALERDGGIIRRVTLLDIGPGPITPDPTGDEVMQLLQEAPSSFESLRAGREHFMKAGLPRPMANWLAMNLRHRRGERRVEWMIDRAAIAAFHGRQRGESLWGVVEAPNRTARILCFRGEASSYVTDSDAERLESARVTVETIPESGHFVHIDAVDELLNILATNA